MLQDYQGKLAQIKVDVELGKLVDRDEVEQKAPVPETQPEPEINEMSDAEVNEELRAIKEMLKKKTA